MKLKRRDRVSSEHLVPGHFYMVIKSWTTNGTEPRVISNRPTILYCKYKNSSILKNGGRADGQDVVLFWFYNHTSIVVPPYTRAGRLVSVHPDTPFVVAERPDRPVLSVREYDDTNTLLVTEFYKIIPEKLKKQIIRRPAEDFKKTRVIPRAIVDYHIKDFLEPWPARRHPS